MGLGPKGAPLRRSNFNRMTGWKYAVEAVGLTGVHFHDLRHTGNTFAAASGIGIKDLMARMGHDSERAAMIYQHEARGADRAITSAIDAHVEAECGRDDDRDDGLGGMLAPVGSQARDGARWSEALGACSYVLLVASRPALASSSQVAACGNRRLLTVVRGHLGDIRSYCVGQT